MREVNWYTTVLFTFGLYALFGYVLHFSPENFIEFLLISALIVVLNWFQITLPSGIVFEAGVIGFLYMLIKFGFKASVLAIMISTFVTFLRGFKSIRKIPWFRFFTSLGMYFISVFLVYEVIHVFEMNVIIKAVIALIIFEILNNFFLVGILKSIRNIPFWKSLGPKLKEIIVPVIFSSIVLARLLYIDNEKELLLELGYTVLFLIAVILSSSEFLKEITLRDRKLAENEQRYKSLFDNNPNAVFSFDLEGRFQSVNKAAEDLVEYTADELIGTSFKPLVVVQDQSKALDAFHRTSNGESLNFDVQLNSRHGRLLDVNITNVPIRIDNEMVGVFGIANDVTEKKRNEEMINYMAYHDVLTDLPNRRLFQEYLTKALMHAKENGAMLAVLLLDMDRFKIINDSLGHAYGDRLLAGVAERLNRSVRNQDTVARMGGDEFTLLLEDISDANQADDIARRILAEFEQPFIIKEYEFYVTASIGISLFPHDGEEAEILMKHADSAMYRAKESGKNNYQFFDAVMNGQSFQRLLLEHDLRKALERNEFVVHYQPQFQINSGEIIGVEALVRWQHPELGLIAPAQFIALAEETGLIIPISEIVLRTACNQVRSWQLSGHQLLRVSVNLSARQFQQVGLVGKIEQILHDTKFDPELLELEITETIAIYDDNLCLDKLHEFKKMGIQIAMDDFGTGYSSLSFLQKYPIDTIKIDQSFVRDITSDNHDAAIVAAILAMAKSLGKNVIAEGVETVDQYNFLRDNGCVVAQGYYFAKPLSSVEIDRLLHNDHSKVL